jgi:hypothetical protein
MCLRFKVQGSRFKVQSSRFKVEGSKFKVQGFPPLVRNQAAIQLMANCRLQTVHSGNHEAAF